MQYKIFSIFDRKSETFGQVMCKPAVGVMTREFVDAVNDEATQLNKHPEDFALFELGIFDDVDGSVDSQIRLISEAKDVIA